MQNTNFISFRSTGAHLDLFLKSLIWKIAKIGPNKNANIFTDIS